MGICCKILGAQTGALWQPRGWDGVGGGREDQEGGHIDIPMAHSFDVWQKPTV